MEKKYVVWNKILYRDLEPCLNHPPQVEPRTSGGADADVAVVPPEYKLDTVVSVGNNNFTVIWKLRAGL